MILSAAINALNTVSLMGYSLDFPDWLLALFGFLFLFVFVPSVFFRFFKVVNNK